MAKVYNWRPLSSKELAALAMFCESAHATFGDDEQTCKELVTHGDQAVPHVMHVLTDAAHVQERAQALGRCFQRAAEKVLNGFTITRRRNDRGNYVYRFCKISHFEPIGELLPLTTIRAVADGELLALAEAAQELDRVLGEVLRLRIRTAELLALAEARYQR